MPVGTHLRLGSTRRACSAGRSADELARLFSRKVDALHGDSIGGLQLPGNLRESEGLLILILQYRKLDSRRTAGPASPPIAIERAANTTLLGFDAHADDSGGVTFRLPTKPSFGDFCAPFFVLALRKRYNRRTRFGFRGFTTIVKISGCRVLAAGIAEPRFRSTFSDAKRKSTFFHKTMCELILPC